MVEIEDLEKEKQVIVDLEEKVMAIIKEIADIIIKDLKSPENLKGIEYQDTKNKIEDDIFEEKEKERIKKKIDDLFEQEKTHTVYGILNSNKEIVYIGTAKPKKIISRIKEHLAYKSKKKHSKFSKVIEHLQEIQENNPIANIYIKTYDIEPSIRSSVEDYLIKHFKDNGMCKWNLRNNSN